MSNLYFKYYDADLGDYTHECRLDSDEVKYMLGSIIYDYFFDNLKCTKEQKKLLKESIGDVLVNFEIEEKLAEDYRSDIDEYLFKHKLYEEI